jgi:tetratricopeptide repeat protein
VTTPTTRLYHSLTARYNTLYNGETAYTTSLESFVEALQEDYLSPLTLDPLTPLVRSARPAGNFARSISKAEKAIQEHSLQRKPAKRPGWRRDPKAVAEQAKTEYNPALSAAWLLWGKSLFYEGRIDEAQASFAEMAQRYATERDQALLWQARCYLQQDRLGESLLLIQRVDSTPQAIARHPLLYHTTRAEYYLLSGARARALPHLVEVIARERNTYLRARLEYLLGQTYETLGQREAAVKAYQQAARRSPRPALEFAARLRMTLLRGAKDEALSALLGLLTQRAYHPYRDQIYLALGEVSLQRRDTLGALGYLGMAIDSATLRGGAVASEAGALLGELQLARRHYPEAWQAFSKSLPSLGADHPRRQHLEPLLPALERLAPLALQLQRSDSLSQRKGVGSGSHADEAETPKLLLAMAELLSGELGRLDDAEVLYARLVRDYPHSAHDLEARYLYLLLSLRRGRGAEADSLRETILSRYPTSPHARLLGAGTDYRARLVQQDSLGAKWYHEAYTAYRAGRPEEAERYLRQIGETLPSHRLKPQALLLEALTRAQLGDHTACQAKLAQLARTYPEGEATELATRMLLQLQAGRRITSTLAVGTGSVSTSQDTTALGVADSLFTAPQAGELPEALVLYPSDGVAPHEAFFALTAFLYQHFTQSTLELTPWANLPLRGLRVRGFQGLGEVERFLRLARSAEGLRAVLGEGCELLLVTEPNLLRLTVSVLGNYRAFARAYEQDLLRTPR